MCTTQDGPVVVQLGYLKVCTNVQWVTPSEEKWNQLLVLCSKNFFKSYSCKEHNFSHF